VGQTLLQVRTTEWGEWADGDSPGRILPALHWNFLQYVVFLPFSYAVTVTVGPTNDDPVAVDDSVSTPEDAAVSIPVLSNDSDVDGDTLTTTAVTAQPSDGTATVNGDGTIQYTPDADFSGTDTFVYSIADGNSGTASATGEYLWMDRLDGACP